jgi:hypothetical protein
MLEGAPPVPQVTGGVEEERPRLLEAEPGQRRSHLDRPGHLRLLTVLLLPEEWISRRWAS